MDATEGMPRQYRTLSLRAVSIDVLVLRRLERAVERRVVIPVVVAHLRLEITRLVAGGAARLAVAIALRGLEVVRSVIARARHRSPPEGRTACKRPSGGGGYCPGAGTVTRLAGGVWTRAVVRSIQNTCGYCLMIVYPSGILNTSSEIGSVVIEVTFVVIFIGPICCIISAICPVPSTVMVISVMYAMPFTLLIDFIILSRPGMPM